MSEIIEIPQVENVENKIHWNLILTGIGIIISIISIIWVSGKNAGVITNRIDNLSDKITEYQQTNESDHKDFRNKIEQNSTDIARLQGRIGTNPNQVKFDTQQMISEAQKLNNGYDFK